MWERFRTWKPRVVPLLTAVALFMMTQSAEGSASWYAGLVLALALGLAYVIEEVVWNLGRSGRPGTSCGHPVFIRSFRVRNVCPNCNKQLQDPKTEIEDGGGARRNRPLIPPFSADSRFPIPMLLSVVRRAWGPRFGLTKRTAEIR